MVNIPIEKITIISTVDANAEVMHYFLEKVSDYSRGRKFIVELIIVDDLGLVGGDNWQVPIQNELISVIFMRNTAPMGQLMSVLRGIHASTGDVLVTIDPDMAENLTDIDVFIEHYIHGADVVYGHRVRRDGVSWWRLFFSKIFGYFVLIASGGRLHDVNTPMVLLSRFARAELLSLPGNVGSLKLYMAYRFGRTFVEVPIVVKELSKKKSSYGFFDICFLFLKDVFAISKFIFYVGLKK
ncbi:MAG: glycosyltransferase [bacterium]|nr:glycosyltransferase [bacterium]